MTVGPKHNEDFQYSRKNVVAFLICGFIITNADISAYYYETQGILNPTI